MLQFGRVGLPLQIVARPAVTMRMDSIKITLTCLKTLEQGAVGTKYLRLVPNGIYRDLDVGLYRETEDHISDETYATKSLLDFPFLALLENAVEPDPLPQNDRIFLSRFLSWKIGCSHCICAGSICL